MRISLQVKITIGTPRRHKGNGRAIKSMEKRLRRLEAAVARTNPVKQVMEVLEKEAGEASDKAYEL